MNRKTACPVKRSMQTTYKEQELKELKKKKKLNDIKLWKYIEKPKEKFEKYYWFKVEKKAEAEKITQQCLQGYLGLFKFSLLQFP